MSSAERTFSRSQSRFLFVPLGAWFGTGVSMLELLSSLALRLDGISEPPALFLFDVTVAMDIFFAFLASVSARILDF